MSKLNHNGFQIDFNGRVLLTPDLQESGVDHPCLI
jgi:hypothetical protein